MKLFINFLLFVSIVLITFSAVSAQKPLPVIDMHLHSLSWDDIGPQRVGICLPMLAWVAPYDARRDGDFSPVPTKPPCKDPIWSATNDKENLEQTIAVLKKRNVIGVLSGPDEHVRAWHKAAPDHIIPSQRLRLERDKLSPADLQRLYATGFYKALGEVGVQYDNIAPNDSRMMPYWALMEELDIPVNYHMGEGTYGEAFVSDTYRARLTDPFLFEDVLRKHPKLRLSVMHYGSPMIDEIIAMLGAYPQLYVELGGIHWFYTRDYFYNYQLKKLIDAGFGKRIMFGSDNITFPGIIEPAIAIIEEAPFLSEEQKRDILYNNAARYLRLSDEEIRRHHGSSLPATSKIPAVKAANESDREYIDRMRREIEKAENSPNDIEPLRRHSAPDIVLVPDGMKPVVGQEAALGLMQEFWKIFDVKTQYNSEEVRIDGDTAFDRGWALEILKNKQTGEVIENRLNYLWVSRKDKSGAWKQIYVMWNKRSAND